MPLEDLVSTEYEDKVESFRTQFKVARADFDSSINVDAYKMVLDAGEHRSVVTVYNTC